MKWPVFALVPLLAGCDPTPPPKPETPRSANPVFETQIQAVEKARGVESEVLDAAEAQRRQLDAETQ